MRQKRRGPQEAGRALPPYGRELEAALRRPGPLPFGLGQRCIWVAAGDDAWEQARISRAAEHAVLVLPPGQTPLEIRWPVQDCDCLIAIRGELSSGLLRSLGVELIRAGSPLVVSAGSGPVIVFKPRQRVA